MRFDTRVLVFPALFMTSGVFAQLSGVATSYTPDVTYTTVNGVTQSFVTCSDQDCAGTCVAVNVDNIPKDDAEGPPNDTGFLSMYWYVPSGEGGLDVYTCLAPGCGTAVQIDQNICYNLYDNGVPTNFYTYYYFVIGGKM